MNQHEIQAEQFRLYRQWFDAYVQAYHGHDTETDKNCGYKAKHCRRTCGRMLFLATCLGLNPGQVELAKCIGLFHDIGRFEQFKRYHTFRDSESVDHGRLGVEILQATSWFDEIPPDTRDIIETAIQWHGQLALPEGLTEDSLLFARMIRDADKLDILYGVTCNDRLSTDDPRYLDFGVGYPDTPGCNDKVVEDVIAGRLVSYVHVENRNDLRLTAAGWMVDINFVPSLVWIRDHGYLEKILSFVDDVTVRETVLGVVQRYLDQRIEG